MELPEALLEILRQEDEPLHWTVIQDLALRRGYLDPFAQPDVRAQVQRTLASLVRSGSIERVGKGVYAIGADRER